ncbi:extracellular solute-binding protein [Paenibacillus donghaensis]|uniref:extracellular solute-binding protein n=1 Tax=Paenibacillus donghaensis TaxID=414771 RepID=UPI00188413EB|nr:extracellular solute-binding protein [Paenibacillus donghaensis]MBE9914587.1 extracellular solute-binding protein [Paenibacillus donghaensis]
MIRKGSLILVLAAVFVVCLILIWIYPPGKAANPPLKVYVIFQEDEARMLLEKFKKETGQAYQVIRMSSGEASYHLLDTDKTGVDVVLGGTADLHEQLKNNGKLLRYSPRMSDKIPEAYKDKEGYWTGMYMGALSIGVNERVWKGDPELASIPYPKRYEDLLRPELKGKIEIPDPETSGTGYTLLASLAQERGPEKAVELMHALKQQSSTTTFSGITSAQRLAVGDVAAVVCFLGDQLRFANSGYAIHSSIPPKAGWEIGGVSILKNGDNRKAAKKLIDFVLSKNAQTAYMNAAFSLPVIPGIEPNPLLADVHIDKLLTSYRADEAAAARAELMKRWRDASKR